ncbi:hypothetical protein CcCBS67573_g01432 [Chytriomyces confervae]|uniref:Ribosomal protein S16 n=1 Tax=Chytriomyces confervae TaxID=246404 RepID=A0A507FLY4_9FUNG|nr:hypothetical protein CcCBS67573_g01432 [Chytriomyces confervae]
MTVKIRLARWGQRNNPFYGVVVANARAPRDGRHLERVGTYNPIPDADKVKHIELNYERIKYWIGVGAQPSDRVAYLLAKAGILPLTPKQMQRQGVLSLTDSKTWNVRITDQVAGTEMVVPLSEARRIVPESSREGKFLANVAAKQVGVKPKLVRLLPRGDLDALFSGLRVTGASAKTAEAEGTDSEDAKKSIPSIGSAPGPAAPKSALAPNERLILLKEFLSVY